ncbi:MAG: hypothetical protein GTO62_06200 [Planctomycetales bacterium]|nr:hypothetical protein [Planctomycetales bacterium]NIP68858.1 hypothetical protein [Planctomycetales bacterium]
MNELLQPLGDCITPEVARRIVDLRAPSMVQQRVEHLAAKSGEGTLDELEQQAYEALVSAGNFIAILQSKARALLKNGS